jgi:hypothetical protein
MNNDTVLFESPCWYVPDGRRTLFSSKKGIVSVIPGSFIIRDRRSGAEVRRLALTSDMTIKNSAGQVSLWKVDGQNVPFRERLQRQITFFNPWLILVSYLLLLFGSKKAKQCAIASRQAATMQSSSTSPVVAGMQESPVNSELPAPAQPSSSEVENTSSLTSLNANKHSRRNKIVASVLGAVILLVGLAYWEVSVTSQTVMTPCYNLTMPQIYTVNTVPNNCGFTASSVGQSVNIIQGLDPTVTAATLQLQAQASSNIKIGANSESAGPTTFAGFPAYKTYIHSGIKQELDYYVLKVPADASKNRPAEAYNITFTSYNAVGLESKVEKNWHWTSHADWNQTTTGNTDCYTVTPPANSISLLINDNCSMDIYYGPGLVDKLEINSDSSDSTVAAAEATWNTAGSPGSNKHASIKLGSISADEVTSNALGTAVFVDAGRKYDVGNGEISNIFEILDEQTSTQPPTFNTIFASWHWK